MVYILGSDSGRATLNDTAGDDTIYARGPANIVNSLYGDDTIIGGHGSVFNVGTPGDGAVRRVTISLFDVDNIVTGGDGDVTITAAQGHSTITLGYGDNNLTLNGGGNTITLGTGNNTIAAYGGNTSISVTDASLLWPDGNFSFSSPLTDHITLSGLGNNVSNNTISESHADPFIPIPMDITGGSGNGTFTLDGGCSIVTGGANNVISVGDGSNFVNPGSGDDTVTLGGFFEDDVNVQLNGTGNVVNGAATSAHIYGGVGHNTVNFDANNYYFPIGADQVRLNGSDNTVTAASGSGSGIIDTGGSNAAITLSGLDFFDMTFRGSGDRLTLNDDYSGGTLHDLSNGLLVDVTGVASLTIDDFGFNRGAVVKVDFGGGTDGFSGTPYASAQAVYDQVQDTAGGAVLSLNNGGQITFAGVGASDLSAKNFAV